MKHSRLQPLLLRALVVMLLALPAQAREPESLHDLKIPLNRVPDWWPVNPTDTSGWRTVNATTEGGTLGCSNAVRSDGKSDMANIQCMIDAAAGTRTVIHLPAGRYNLDDQQGLRMRSGTALEGEGTATVVELSGKPDYVADSCLGLSWFNFVGSAGARTTWTGKFAKGDYVLEVGDASIFSVDDWVTVHMNADKSQLYSHIANASDPDATHWEYTVQIRAIQTASSPQAITIDRPLRLDYTASGNRWVQRIAPVSESGIQNLKVEWSVQDNGHVVCMTRAADDWVRDVEFDTYFDKAVLIENNTARNLVFRNWMHDGKNDTSRYPIHVREGASDNHVHMNRCSHEQNCIVVQQGAIGNLFTYNYAEQCGSKERIVLMHGEYASENLFEGNESNDCTIDIDNFYGRQGVRNTLFRNRGLSEAVDQVKPRHIRSHADNADEIIAEEFNMILNFGAAYYQPVGCKATFAEGTNSYQDGRCDSWDYDRGNTANGGNLYISPWAERNIGLDTRSAADCTADQEPYSCCTGPSTPPDKCVFGAAFSSNFKTGNVDNLNGSSAPAGWSSVSFPYSLVSGWDLPTARPFGWCNEITEWPLMGADVDSAPTSKLPKSPAHRLMDGDACTTSDGNAGGGGNSPPPLPPPVLLP